VLSAAEATDAAAKRNEESGNEDGDEACRALLPDRNAVDQMTTRLKHRTAAARLVIGIPTLLLLVGDTLLQRRSVLAGI